MRTFGRFLLALLGLVLLVVGVGGAAYVGPDDEVHLGSHQIGTAKDRLFVSRPGLFGYRDLTVTLRAASPGGVFIGSGDAVDVSDYTKGVAHHTIATLDGDGKTSGSSIRGAEAPDVAPTAAKFWTRSVSGSGTRELTVDLDASRPQVVVAPLKPGGATTLAFGAVLDGIFVICVLVALVGLSLLLLAIALIRRARGRRAGGGASGARDREPDPRPAPMVGEEARTQRTTATRGRARLGFASVLVLALGTSGCFAVPKKVDDESTPVKTALHKSELAGLFTSYDARNNAAIKKTGPPKYNPAPWGTADVGPLLAADTYDSAFAKATNDRSANVFKHTGVNLYAPRLSAYPLWVLTTNTSVQVGKKVDKDAEKYVNLAAFARPHATDAWLQDSQVSALRKDVPAALPPGRQSTASDADRSKAKATLARLENYWKTGTKPAGMTLAPGAEVPRQRLAKLKAQVGPLKDNVRVSLSGFSEARGAIDGPAGALKVVRVKGGLLALAAYSYDLTVQAGPNTTLSFSGTSAKIFGGDQRSSLLNPYLVTAAVFVPQKGQAKVLGASTDEALE